MKKNAILTLLATVIIMCTAVFSACGSAEKTIVGSWVKENGDEILVFKDNGTCSVPFTYNNSWWESCDLYTFTENELILSSKEGNISTRRYEKCENPEDVEDSNQYYLSGDTLIINEDTYTRGK